MKKDVFVLVGAGQIGLAIARRMAYGLKVIVADKNLDNAEKICGVMSAAGSDFLADGGATAAYFYGNDIKE